MFGGIKFGDLVKNSPIRQIKIPAKVSSYTVYNILNSAITFVYATFWCYIQCMPLAHYIINKGKCNNDKPLS